MLRATPSSVKPTTAEGPRRPRRGQPEPSLAPLFSELVAYTANGAE
jgi:hypothetical protein